MQTTRLTRTILALTAGAALAACGPAAAPRPIGSPAATVAPAEPAALPQARAALAAGQPAVTIALIGPWAADSPAAAELLAAAHVALAEELLAERPAAPEATRAAVDRLGLALAVAPAGEMRQQIADRRAALIAGAGAPAAEPSAAPAARPATAGAGPAPRPRPTPPPAPAFAVAQRKSFEGSGASGQFASCVDVQILGRGGPVAGAVVEVNNGEHGYQSQTDATGYAGRCGLGASTWSVVLVWTPAGGASGVATTVYLSGGPEQRAAVVFQEP